MRPLAASIGLLLSVQSVLAQAIDTVQFTYVSEFLYQSFLPYSCLSAKFDDAGRPYLYTANVELGIVVFDVSNIQDPIPVDTVLPAELGSLKPTNLWHQNGLLYASIGGIQGVSQDAGLAIFDLSDPTDLSILDIWSDPTFDQGAAIVIVEGDHAYVGAMELGVIILNVSDPSDIQFEGHTALDPNFPRPPGLFSVPNARGMSIRNDTLIVANDAGGLRMVDVSNKQQPVELSKYINPDMDAITQSAYNNVLLIDRYAFVSVDYCGLDVVDVSDTNMVNAAWLNPWACNGANWNGAEGHSNEIGRVSENLVFMTGGDSELLAYDVSDRTQPELVGAYSFPYDSVVAWGLTHNDQHVVLCLVNNRILQQPYYSNVGGIMILEWNTVLGLESRSVADEVFAYPNPATNQVNIRMSGNYSLKVTSASGQLMLDENVNGFQSIDVTDWSGGVYVLSVEQNNSMHHQKLVIQKAR